MTISLSDNERVALRDEVKREIKEELRQEERSRRWHGFLIRVAVYLTVLGVSCVIGLVLLARTGLMTVPLLSSRLYHPVMPTRVVTPLVGSNAEVVWREVLASMKYDSLTGDATVSFNEVRLTTIVREGMTAQAESLPFKAEEGQIVLEDGTAELFFYTERSGRKVPVRLAFIPGVDLRGNLSMVVTEAKLGGADMPAMARDSMAKLLNSFLRNEFTSQLPPGFIWRRISVERDNLKIVFTAPQ